MSINPDRLTYIVKIAATLFDHTNKTINPNPNKISEMHFVADLLKDLVNTAYPIEPTSIINSNELLSKDIEAITNAVISLMSYNSLI